MKLKDYISDNQGREWQLTADIDGAPFETEDGQGNSGMAVDVDYNDIFLEITNKDGKCVHILYFKDMDKMKESGLFEKKDLKELDDTAQELVLQDNQEWKQCGHDLNQ